MVTLIHQNKCLITMANNDTKWTVKLKKTNKTTELTLAGNRVQLRSLLRKPPESSEWMESVASLWSVPDRDCILLSPHHPQSFSLKQTFSREAPLQQNYHTAVQETAIYCRWHFTLSLLCIHSCSALGDVKVHTDDPPNTTLLVLWSPFLQSASPLLHSTMWARTVLCFACFIAPIVVAIILPHSSSSLIPFVSLHLLFGWAIILQSSILSFSSEPITSCLAPLLSLSSLYNLLYLFKSFYQ